MDGIQFEIVYLGLHEFTTIWGTMGTSSTRYEMPTVELWGLWPALITCINPNYMFGRFWEKQQEKNCFSFWSHFPWTATPTHIFRWRVAERHRDRWHTGLATRSIVHWCGRWGSSCGSTPRKHLRGMEPRLKRGQPGSHIGHRPWEGHKSHMN